MSPLSESRPIQDRPAPASSVEVLGSPSTVVSPVVVIPAYKPTPALAGIVRTIASDPLVNAVVVINDGSGPAYDDLFSDVARIAGVEVLRHVVNLGKGAALKTGLNHAACQFSESV